MPKRSFEPDDYRFGYNGQEKDDEVKGTGNSIEFKYRIYDSRLGRFLSIDPLSKKYPWYTPYQFAGNKPIWKIDLDGLEEADPKGTGTPAKDPTAQSPSQTTAKDNLSYIAVPESLKNQADKSGGIPIAPLPPKPLPGEGIVYPTPPMNPPSLDQQSLSLARSSVTKAIATGGLLAVGVAVAPAIVPSSGAIARTVLQVKSGVEAAVVSSNTPLGYTLYSIGVNEALNAVGEKAPPLTVPYTPQESGAEMGTLLFDCIQNFISSEKK